MRVFVPQLCKGRAEDGTGYAGSSVHIIRRGFGLTAGDYVAGTGRGGRSASGAPLADENFVGRHSEAGTVSMANSGVDSGSSVFFISTAPAPHLDGKHVVFGEVVQGYETVKAMEAVGSGAGTPSATVTIVDSGELPAADVDAAGGAAESKE